MDVRQGIGFILILYLLVGSCLPAAASGETAEDSAMRDLTTGQTLYVVGYAHLDSQWRWSYPQTISEFLYNTLHDNFALFEANPDYVFNFSGARRYMMMKEYFPAEYSQLEDYIARGRWFPCGSSVDECDVIVPSAESLIRQVLYGNNYFRREFGTASVEFMLPDCFGFPASLPQLLAHCGVEGFSTQKLTWSSAVGIPFNLGVWESPDGRTAIFAAFNPGSYGSRITSDLSQDEEWQTRIQQNGESTGIFADFHYYGTGDVGGSPDVGSVDWLEKSLGSGGPITVLSGPADQLFRDLQNAPVGKLPRYQGDLLLTEHSAGSLTSQAYMKRWNRQNELLASGAELASVSARLVAGLPYPREKLDNAWLLTLGSQMHDILPGTCLPQAYQYAWNDEVLALNQFADVLITAAESVASGLDTTGAGIPLVVFNPLFSDREDVVEARLEYQESPPQAVQVIGPDGSEVPSQILAQEDNALRVLFLASVPAGGFAVYDVCASDDPYSGPTGLAVDESSLENDRYRVEINPAGDIASVYDKQLRRELLAAPARLVFTHDAPDYWPAWNIDWEDQQQPPYAYVGGPAELSVEESGPVRVALRIKRSAQDSEFSQVIRLSAGDAGQRLEVASVIDWRSQGCNLKAAFPLTASNPLATYNWGTCTIQRGNNDERKYEVPSHQWIDLTNSDESFGVTVLTPFKYGSDKPDDGTLRLTLLRTPGVRNDDYADQATQDWGRHEIKYGLIGHQAGWQTAQTDWEALRFEQPLIAFQASAHSGNLGRQFSLLSVDNPRVRILAAKQAEAGEATILRLVELDGHSQQARLEFAVPVTFAREVNGQEQPIGDLTVDNGGISLEFLPNQIRTIAIQLEPMPGSAAPVQSIPVQLPYNRAVTSRDGEAARLGFDPDGYCLPAELFPAKLVDAGIEFVFGPAGTGELNAVACQGQEVPLPDSGCSKVYLIAASTPSDQQAEFLVDGAAQPLAIQDWGGFIGQWDTRVWRGDLPELAFRWANPLDHIQAGFIKRSPVAWYSSHRHTPQGRNAVYEYAYLYRYALEIPADARSIRLPDNPAVLILAMTAVTGAVASFEPAGPLYDTLADQQDMYDLPEVVKVPKRKQ